MTGAALASRYLIVGVTCALVNNLVLIGGDALRLPLVVSVGGSFVLVCLVGYRLHAAVTFGRRTSWRGLARYVLAMAAGLPASAGLLWLFARALHWPMAIAAPAATVAMLLVNFLSSRWAVLHPPRLRTARIAP